MHIAADNVTGVLQMSICLGKNYRDIEMMRYDNIVLFDIT